MNLYLWDGWVNLLQLWMAAWFGFAFGRVAWVQWLLAIAYKGFFPFLPFLCSIIMGWQQAWLLYTDHERTVPGLTSQLRKESSIIMRWQQAWLLYKDHERTVPGLTSQLRKETTAFLLSMFSCLDVCNLKIASDHVHSP
jgi:hypothetical protein